MGGVILVGSAGVLVVGIGRGSGPEVWGVVGLWCVKILGVWHVSGGSGGSVLDWRPDQALAGGWTVESYVEVRAGFMMTVSCGIPPRKIII
jgi:hypothetical protein